jgi:HPt (histidine-containing phosphotransfer) domain-containing protein
MNATPSGPAADDEPKLDAAAIKALRELDPDGKHGVFLRVLQAYESSLQRKLAELAGARGRGDAKAVSEIAHLLKSSSGSVGALAFAARCVEVERAIRAGRSIDLDAEVENLLTEGERALRAVRAMLHS